MESFKLKICFNSESQQLVDSPSQMQNIALFKPKLSLAVGNQANVYEFISDQYPIGLKIAEGESLRVWTDEHDTHF